jgi:small-conductance mechanosensitive channel
MDFAESLSAFLGRPFLGSTVREDVKVLLGILVGIGLVRLFQVFVIRRLRRIFSRTVTTWDDLLVEALEKDVVPALYVIIVYLGLRDLPWRKSIQDGIRTVATTLITVLAVRVVLAIVNNSIQAYWKRHAADRTAAREKNLNGIITMAKIVVWVLGFLLLLDNLGIKISAFMAGLGITGIAVALAAQAILGDLFSYFVIFFDQPFETGHNIKVGDLQGEVEHIGLKTTRLRSGDGEQIIMSNKSLTDAKVQNFKRMHRRRVVYQLDFDPSTPAEALRSLPAKMKAQYARFPDVTFERCHFVRFVEGNPRFETAYVVETPDFGRHLDIQHEVNLGLHEELAQSGIRLAIPARAIRIRSGRRRPEGEADRESGPAASASRPRPEGGERREDGPAASRPRPHRDPGSPETARDGGTGGKEGGDADGAREAADY